MNNTIIVNGKVIASNDGNVSGHNIKVGTVNGDVTGHNVSIKTLNTL